AGRLLDARELDRRLAARRTGDGERLLERLLGSVGVALRLEGRAEIDPRELLERGVTERIAQVRFEVALGLGLLPAAQRRSSGVDTRQSAVRGSAVGVREPGELLFRLRPLLAFEELARGVEFALGFRLPRLRQPAPNADGNENQSQR